jgi:hypothetical protein
MGPFAFSLPFGIGVDDPTSSILFVAFVSTAAVAPWLVRQAEPQPLEKRRADGIRPPTTRPKSADAGRRAIYYEKRNN